MRGDTRDGYNRSWYRCHTTVDSLTFALLPDLWLLRGGSTVTYWLKLLTCRAWPSNNDKGTI